ncbi:MAG: response regulator transcription factor [Bacteriovoracia bacterium]
MKKIWIVEDDTDALFVYREILGSKYEIRIFKCLREFSENFKALKANAAETPHLLIADLTLPDGHFFEFLSQQEALLPNSIPFLVVSSCDNIEILQTCFKEGAIDYLTKPFTRSELIVKIERFFLTPATRGNLDSKFTFDPTALALKKGDDVLAQLTARELQIFSLLHRARGRIVRRKEMQDEVWKNVTVSAKTLDVHLYNLRKKLSQLDVEIQFQSPDGYTLSGEGMNP